MSHLGTRATALADGQLSAGEAERALAHAVACSRCARDLAEARAARATLSAVPDVLPDPSLTARLLAMTPPASVDRGDPVRHPVLGSSIRQGLKEPGLGIGARVVVTLAGAGGALGCALFTVGAGPVVTPNLHPAEPLTVLGQADTSMSSGTAVSTSGGDIGALTWMDEHGWRRPTGMPAGYAVEDMRLEGEGGMLELDLEGMATSATMVIRQQEGRLDATALTGVEARIVDGREVYLLSTAPWHVVWQSGSTVVDIVADAPETDVFGLVTAFPRGEYDSGIPARIGRGWTTMTGAIGIP